MLLVLTFLVCFFACVVGAICGIGGGVIIKPVLDALGLMDVAAVSFLSGCTVLTMTAYSVLRARAGDGSPLRSPAALPLALGGALGGVLGRQLFQLIRQASPAPDLVGAVQAICLLLVTLGALLYTLRKDRISTRSVRSVPGSAVIGGLLGLLSAFLGIGGGPINLVVLFYFFSMDTKDAAATSLYIILFSQAASLLASLLTRTVPAFPPAMLLLMAGGGICGGICGRGINRRLDSRAVDRLFLGLMVVMLLINLYNIYQFL